MERVKEETKYPARKKADEINLREDKSVTNRFQFDKNNK
jgi:hypothetical protein